MRLFVPGRVCLFGEHSDWAGEYRASHPEITPGRALIAGTEQGIHAEVGPHPDALVLTSTQPDGRREAFRISLDPDALLREAAEGGFWSYGAGVAFSVLRRHPRVRGLEVENFRTDLPVRKGLSSSAAWCVLLARAFNRVYHLGLSVRQEMDLAYSGEITTPSRCGRMDQGCAFGRGPVLMTFDGAALETSLVPLTGVFHLMVVDLCARKDTRRILARLHRSFPVARSAIDRGLQDLLGPTNQRIVGQAVAALAAGDAAGLGALMVEAQDLFDRYAAPACPEELTAPALHRVLSHAALRQHVWGGKGVGSQGDGAAQLLARSAEDREAALEIIRRDLGMPCLQLTLAAGQTGGT